MQRRGAYSVFDKPTGLSICSINQSDCVIHLETSWMRTQREMEEGSCFALAVPVPQVQRANPTCFPQSRKTDSEEASVDVPCNPKNPFSVLQLNFKFILKSAEIKEKLIFYIKYNLAPVKIILQNEIFYHTGTHLDFSWKQMIPDLFYFDSKYLGSVFLKF